MTPTADKVVSDFRKRLADIREMSSPLAEDQRHQVDIRDLRPNGFFRLHGNTYRVLEVSRYAEKKGKYEWFELKIRNVLTGEELFIEWEYDDSVEIFLNHKINFRTLPFSSSWINGIWEDDDESARFDYQGQTFYIEEWDDGNYFRNNEGGGERFRFFDFLNEDEDVCIGIEIWDGEYEASLGNAVDPDDIEVLDLGGN